MLSVIFKYLKILYYIILTLPRDLAGLAILFKIKRKEKYYDSTNLGVPDVFGEWVKTQPEKACIIFNDTTWTFRDMENYGNKMANLFSEKLNFRKGDCVALFMENKPEFVGIWYGLSKLGVITACINTNLRQKTLIHSIEVAKPKFVIYDEELEQPIMDVKDQFKLDLNFIRQGKTKPAIEIAKNIPILENLLAPISELFSPSYRVFGKDVLMYIYTSGTTGLPKPAVIKHNRFMIGGFSFFDAAKLTPDDVFLVTLPIYHSNAGVLGIGATIISGATVVLRKKFSATNFWKDAIRYKCTAFSYVGEVCRYLLNQPPSDLDKKHSIRLCIGNGMRENVQKEFTSRFNIKCLEIYGATEGNCVLINTTGKLGACGYVPVINKFITVLPVYIIKIDENDNPVRDENGFCVECEYGEKGLIVGVISKSTKSDYSGYANNEEASNKKVIFDLFKKGQKGFNTGDLAVADNYGYFYFVDRLGDTFRWRGENVSTVEVENIISARIDSKEVIVYGVQIPGQEGRAGMATITDNSIDIDQLGKHIKTDLTAYAKPLFIRLKENVEHTGSFKAQKAILIQENYNVRIIKDKLFYYDLTEQKYKELTESVYDKIQQGLVRF